MKKNVVGHMVAAKEPVTARVRRWHLFPKLLCLLLALLIWLVVVNFEKHDHFPSDGEGEDDALWLIE
ncbi:MAG: hypothetical protein E7666_04995 [Ruminococcaceae bacterium]|nr:hypothetical protein [Oscillospiraceae bacterium]